MLEEIPKGILQGILKANIHGNHILSTVLSETSLDRPQRQVPQKHQSEGISGQAKGQDVGEQLSLSWWAFLPGQVLLKGDFSLTTSLQGVGASVQV